MDSLCLSCKYLHKPLVWCNQYRPERRLDGGYIVVIACRGYEDGQANVVVAAALKAVRSSQSRGGSTPSPSA